MQENCEQLLRHNGILAQREQEVKKDAGIKKAGTSQIEIIFSDRSSRTITIDGHVGEIPSNPEVCFFEE